MRIASSRPLDESIAAVDRLVVLILGPTGSGKTALSLALGEQFNGEIVSCDSVAVYRGMDLGTAKPTAEERLRLPHHLIDVADPDQPFTAGEYSRLARQALRDITARNRLPIVTGGTGLYLRALTDGLFAGPARQQDLRDRLKRSHERHGGGWLHRLLARLDAASAARIHSNDTPKLIRAIEVCVAARQPMSQVMARDPLTGYRLLRDRPESAATAIVRTAESTLRGNVQRRACGRDARIARPLRCSDGAGLARLPAIVGGPQWRVNTRSRNCRRAAGPSQLRQAPAHLVPARARCALDCRIRR